MTEQHTETALTIPGPAGQLEAILATHANDQPIDKIAIICHPHPLHGGTMNNKVITTVARSFRDCNIASLRFNYRGVGKSEGVYADTIGELADLLAVSDWIKQQYPQASIYLAGFSFGAYIVYRACAAIQPQLLITIAPAVNHQDFLSLPLPECPWIIVQGDEDEIVPASEVYAWLDHLTIQPTIVRFADASHFFHGKLMALREQLTHLINSAV